MSNRYKWLSAVRHFFQMKLHQLVQVTELFVDFFVYKVVTASALPLHCHN